MKTIGLIGGMSWESTQTYYRLINQKVREQLGGLHSAKLILYSVDFSEIEALQHQGDWEGAAKILVAAAQSVQSAGADFLVICTNTMHKVAPQIEQATAMPLLHIADATAKALLSDGITSVGLLGTQFTMEQAFYRERLEQKGITVIIPNHNERTVVHRIIYDELCQGIVNPESKAAYLDVVAGLAARGAQAVILGCTEIGLLIQASDTQVALYDTTDIHADQAVALALN
ncbi:aspartate/glutamate racemase family protein [Marinobacter sp. M3C]|jgi:aspartate racemase|uniref:aspartate/glutamate racemase family protein n=1 Tax=unclassified Marinobacter TaxID=83889 RepID=UPI00200F60CA|nr:MULTISPECIES: aspartate/glutamate racemase family protein [unclassified Marinobacter]MCL1479426.1 aspartate/glutamate racemase family protein [Marinobacter sp.]MCL1482101.1 aspartate/glutamate racemase family protein [Marinobacter sp.]MCL1483130.1 aspartate/glutamate racemase family protein [Marinobacter sp.]MCL1488588.1 aspartate/glutamate racemase family protein [Marinobacter sp.]UQG54567.1 aspartate/glutamate racemase family protein [Marinobacter sp. M4C]